LPTAASCVSAASAYFPAGRSRLTTSRIKPSPAPGGELVLFPRGLEQAMQFRRRLGVHGVVQHPSGRVLELPRRGVLGRRPFFAAWLPLANRATARLSVRPDGDRFDVSGLPRSRPPVGLGSWRSARTRRIRPETRRSFGLRGKHRRLRVVHVSMDAAQVDVHPLRRNRDTNSRPDTAGP